MPSTNGKTTDEKPTTIDLVLGGLDDLPAPRVPYRDGEMICFDPEPPEGSVHLFARLRVGADYEAVLRRFMDPDSLKEWDRRKKALNKDAPDGVTLYPMSAARMLAAVGALMRHYFAGLFDDNEATDDEEAVGKSEGSSRS